MEPRTCKYEKTIVGFYAGVRAKKKFRKPLKITFPTTED